MNESQPEDALELDNSPCPMCGTETSSAEKKCSNCGEPLASSDQRIPGSNHYERRKIKNLAQGLKWAYLVLGSMVSVLVLFAFDGMIENSSGTRGVRENLLTSATILFYGIFGCMVWVVGVFFLTAREISRYQAWYIKQASGMLVFFSLMLLAGVFSSACLIVFVPIPLVLVFFSFRYIKLINQYRDL